MRAFAICGMALILGAAAPPPTPQEAWKAGIADENKDYAQVAHAMLKIQDAAYLGEGQSVALQGRKGQPGSWHWSSGAGAQGPVRISLQGGKLAVTQNGKAVDPALIAKSLAVDTDVDIAGQPTQVGAGIPGWRIFVYNQKNPAVKNFTSVAYFPYDPAFRVTARFTPDPKLPAHVFRTSRGTDKQFFHAGDARFVLKGKPVTLPFYTDAAKDIKDMSAFFTDDLTGKGAYGAGRYVDVADFGKFPPASVTIDFNNAYNPNCARSAFFTCPLAIDTIALAMTAGERDPHSLH
jgi:uncharacterized protein (DUF1684 family)